MKLNTLTKLMKWIIAVWVAAAAVFLTGCNVPIRTTFDATIAGTPISYKSEKDVKVIKRSYDPTTGNLTEEVEIEAVASAPALVQAERDKVQAETTATAMKLATEIINRAAQGVGP
jgi:hypothetical protein